MLGYMIFSIQYAISSAYDLTISVSFIFINWDNDNLNRSNFGWNNKTFVITMNHYQRTNKPPRNTPRGLPSKVFLAILSKIFYFKRFREVFVLNNVRYPIVMPFHQPSLLLRWWYILHLQIFPCQF